MEEKSMAAVSVDRFLEFNLGTEAFGVPLLKIREVIAPPKTTPIPNSPAYFIGIMNLRGQVIPIVDLGKKLGVKTAENNPEAAVVIIDVNSVQVGVTVDTVNRVLAVSSDALTEPPAIDRKKNDHIQSIFRNADHMTLILNIDSALDVTKLKLEKTAA